MKSKWTIGLSVINVYDEAIGRGMMTIETID